LKLGAYHHKFNRNGCRGNCLEGLLVQGFKAPVTPVVSSPVRKTEPDENLDKAKKEDLKGIRTDKRP